MLALHHVLQSFGVIGPICRKVGFASPFSIGIIFFSFVSSCKKDSRETSSFSAKLLPPAYGVYHSAYPDFSDSEDSVTSQTITAFETMVNKNLAWVYFSNNWWNGIKFPKREVEIIHSLGKVPFIRIMARSNQTGNNIDPVFSLQKIIDGVFDADILQWAEDARNTNIPLLCEFGTEVNGDWFSWNGRWNGGGETNGYGSSFYADGPERFRNAYEHIVELFRKKNTENVTWFFHVNYDSSPAISWNAMKEYYPGDDYIDWLGISVYGAQEPGDYVSWADFTELLDTSYPEFASISAIKPMALLEFGVVEDSTLGSKAKWITDALASIKNGRYPRIKGISYWNESWENSNGSISHLELNSSPQALNAYKSMVADTFFSAKPIFTQ